MLSRSRRRRSRRVPGTNRLKLFQHRVDADGIAGFDGLQQRDFNKDFLRGGVAQAAFGIGQHFHDARERIDIDERQIAR